MPIEHESKNAGIAFRYNPQFLSDKELGAIFIGRKRALQELETCLRESSPKQVPQHILLTGPRGMGKTTLLHRLALQVREDKALAAHWLPLTSKEKSLRT